MAQKGDQIAAVIVEPVAGNMGLVQPADGFLNALRQLTAKSGSLLIFDEVMTGFRVAYGGAQSLFGITPDITCFGKIIGGGMPVGAYGGSADVMQHIAPQGPVYQAGTLSGNPVAMAAGLATLRQLQQPGFYEKLDQTAHRLATGLEDVAEASNVGVSVARVGSMLGLFFNDHPVRNFADAKTSRLDRFARYYQVMLEKGIYLAPSQFEALFLSAAHTDAHIDQTVAAAEAVFADLAQ
jgi:glutamate-1-semialdehyde 2,1-aminomutase